MCCAQKTRRKIERNILRKKDVRGEEKCAYESESVKYFRIKFKPYKTKYFRMEGIYMCIKFVYCGSIIS
jgi:hypothetical protein